MRVGLAATLLTWIFLQLGSEMAEGDTRAFDMVLLRTMQAQRDRHPWVCTWQYGHHDASYDITVDHLALVSALRMAGFVAIAINSGAVGISLLRAPVKTYSVSMHDVIRASAHRPRAVALRKLFGVSNCGSSSPARRHLGWMNHESK
ncbi:MAG: hypothetical protein IPJ48_13640 [Propionivibrio sp.]|uniref:Uncharacterized protein n=1 Tax=Candidatus Propionivibrio dominans TaxID=2954373 RepID=A0A9D7F8M5_9RHOO|nr:hypothetical protein [Comamonadaceae bacterium]MBK7424042.1 hypothetical protein [Candidatus Propionivibrio dominans]